MTDRRRTARRDDPSPTDPTTGQPIATVRRRRPVVLVVVLLVAASCLLACVGSVAYAVTRVGPEVRREVSGVTSTEVARQLGALGTVGPGTYVIRADELTAGLTRQLDDGSGDPRAGQVTIDPDGIEVTVDLGAQTVGYRSRVVAQDGEIRLVDGQTDAGLLGNVVPDDWVAGGLEDGLNGWFRGQGLVVTGVELVDGEARITTEAAPAT